jgi:hypothetical protein
MSPDFIICVEPAQSGSAFSGNCDPKRRRGAYHFCDYGKDKMRSALNIVNIVLIVVLVAAAVSVHTRVEASGISPFHTLVD